MLHEITVNGIITEVEFKPEPLREIHIRDTSGTKIAIINEFKFCTLHVTNLNFDDIKTIYVIANNFESYFLDYLNSNKRFLLINAYAENAFRKDYNFFLTARYYTQLDKDVISELEVNESHHIENSETYILRIK